MSRETTGSTPGLLALVDEQDRLIGSAEKLSAHQPPGQLHRAFSVFLFDEQGRVLMQQRAASKYHFGGLWSNSCCGHPGPDEDVAAAASKRTDEELGVGLIPLTAVDKMLYSATDPGSGLIERELDHLLVGRFSGSPVPNPDEVMATRWVSWTELSAEVTAAPERFTPWLPLALPRVAQPGPAAG
jgi:isopentenyl-diphosphate Delta-isomerase